MKRIFGLVIPAVLMLTFAPAAFAHATITPAEPGPHTRAEFTLRLEEEVDGARTTRVEMAVPAGFSLQAVANDPGWHGVVAGDLVTWAGRGALAFPFTGTPGAAGDYAFDVRQTYSDGTVVDWAGTQGSDTPAALVHASEGGLSTLVIVVFVAGALTILVAAVALLARNRSLA
jgi:uncharacterized protein YcnI